jgi:hypothetical protein
LKSNFIALLALGMFGILACVADRQAHASRSRAARGLAVLAITGFNALLLVFFSVDLLAISLASIEAFDPGARVLIPFLLVAFSITALVAVGVAGWILSRPVQLTDTQNVSPALLKTAGLAGSIAAAGPLLGLIFRSTDLGATFAWGLLLFAGFLLQPIGVWALYQTIVIAVHRPPAH